LIEEEDVLLVLATLPKGMAYVEPKLVIVIPFNSLALLL
jgi:hypothetical protein